MEPCPRCGKPNEAGATYCSRCGIEIATVRREIPEDEGDLASCYRHPKRQTRLRCGKCDRPICDKCTLFGAAGQRCPDCARHDIKFRPAAVGLGVSRTFRDLWSNPYRLWILVIVLGMLAGGFRGCSMMGGSRPRVAVPANDE